jgi:hypothetical protein
MNLTCGQSYTDAIISAVLLAKQAIDCTGAPTDGAGSQVPSDPVSGICGLIGIISPPGANALRQAGCGFVKMVGPGCAKDGTTDKTICVEGPVTVTVTSHFFLIIITDVELSWTSKLKDCDTDDCKCCK